MIRGINTSLKARPDGTKERFTYAWRGPNAPRLYAERGTPEFEDEYRRACEGRRVEVRAIPARLSGSERVFAERFAPGMLRKARARGVQKGLPGGLDAADLLALFRKQNARCAVSGIPFDLHQERRAGCKFNAYAPSIDRIDHRCGYALDNVRLVLFAVNAAINQWGLETYIEIARAAVKTVCKVGPNILMLGHGKSTPFAGESQ